MPLKLPSKSEIMMATSPEYAELCGTIERLVTEYSHRLAHFGAVRVNVSLYDVATIHYVMHEIRAYHPDYEVRLNSVHDVLEIRLK